MLYLVAIQFLHQNALAVTWPRNPVESHIFEDSCKTSLLVIRFGVIEAADLGRYVIMSVVVFHSTPWTLASGQFVYDLPQYSSSDQHVPMSRSI